MRIRIRPYVFGPPGSESDHNSEARIWNRNLPKKIVRKTLIPNVFRDIYDFLSFKNEVNEPSKSNKQENLEKIVFVGVLKVNDENSRIRIRIF
jgi:hypothetical protein